MTKTTGIVHAYSALALLLGATACDSGSSSNESSGSLTGASADDGMDSGADDGTSAGDDGTGDGGTGSGDGGTGDTSGGGDDGGDVVIDPQNMIDDLDDGDSLIRPAGGRQGSWYTYNDETMGATQTPAATDPFVPVEGGPDGSVYEAKTSGSGFATWGAGLGVDLNNEGDPMGGAGVKMPWDASAHEGIAFMAKGNQAVRVKLQIEAIIPTAQGGTCEMECEDSHGAIIALTGEWKQYTVTFDEVFQEGWGTAATFDAAKLMGVQFQVKQDLDFEFSVDEIGFY